LPQRDFSINDAARPSVNIPTLAWLLALTCRPTWQEATNFVVDLHWLTRNLLCGAKWGSRKS
jgi:hypothetical protein